MVGKKGKKVRLPNQKKKCGMIGNIGKEGKIIR